MSLPVVAIVGRPNVGKSSLLNALTRRRIAIVDAVPGVTRDRVSSPLPLGDGYVELIDTGGFVPAARRDEKRVEPEAQDADLAEHVVSQIDYAIAEAGLIIFLVDARDGLTPLDRAVAEKLRRQDTPVILVANKVDRRGDTAELGELNALGFGEPLAVSALHRNGLKALTDRMDEGIGQAGEKPDEPVMKLAIVGKRNVGKSTFINALAGGDRVIVSERPGTTRDSVDVTFDLDGRTLVAIDTAGVRKRRKLADDIEYYSRHRALRSIRRADVVLFLLDATEPVGRVDRQLLEYVADAYKPVVIVINKWDLAADRATRDDYAPYLTEAMPELAYAPIIFATARTGKGVVEAVKLAGDLFAQARHRVGTGELNAVMAEISARHSPRAAGAAHRPAKLFYATQIATAPPTIVCFVSNLPSFDANYQRYMLGQLRQRLPFAEVPIRLIFRPRRRDQRP